MRQPSCGGGLPLGAAVGEQDSAVDGPCVVKADAAERAPRPERSHAARWDAVRRGQVFTVIKLSTFEGEAETQTAVVLVPRRRTVDAFRSAGPGEGHLVPPPRGASCRSWPRGRVAAHNGHMAGLRKASEIFKRSCTNDSHNEERALHREYVYSSRVESS